MAFDVKSRLLELGRSTRSNQTCNKWHPMQIGGLWLLPHPYACPMRTNIFSISWRFSKNWTKCSVSATPPCSKAGASHREYWISLCYVHTFRLRSWFSAVFSQVSFQWGFWPPTSLCVFPAWRGCPTLLLQAFCSHCKL